MIAEIADAYADGIDTLDDMRGSAWYRTEMVRVWVPVPSPRSGPRRASAIHGRKVIVTTIDRARQTASERTPQQ